MSEGAHVNHMMVLYGEDEIFASHVVYKAPHNYQVILKLNLPHVYCWIYLKEKEAHPSDQFIYILNPIDIRQIASLSAISGVVFRRDHRNQRFDLIPNLKIDRSDFEIVYYDELPLSLQSNMQMGI